MSVLIVFPQTIMQKITEVAHHSQETAGVLLCSVFETPNGNQRLLARRIYWVDENSYIQRDQDSMIISSDGYIHALGEAEKIGATCLWVHTHPGHGALPIQSEHDHIVDRQLAELFRIRTNSPFYGALIFSPRDGGVTFTGFLEPEDEERMDIGRLWQVGDRWRLTHAHSDVAPGIQAMFDRNIRALGPEIQSTLGDLHVGIVGCGGTGSSVGEQLVRLGVRHFTLIDPDTISESNTTRVYGSNPSNVGSLKAETLSRHLQQIAPNALVESVIGMITTENVAKKLTNCDVIFGCTDDNAGRLILSRLAIFFLIPIIDCGVLLSSNDTGILTGIDGRVTTIVPDQACLVCRGRIDLARAASELLTPDERLRRIDEGYAPALGRTEPAVVAFTTMVASVAVGELLERLIGYGSEPRPSEVMIRAHEREISTNIALPHKSHYCHPSNGKLGIGLTNPFLEQTWQNEK